LSVGEDGLLYTNHFDPEAFEMEVTYDPTAGVEGANFLPEDDLKELKKRKMKAMREEHPANFKVLGDTSEHIDDTELVVTLKLEQETEQDVTDDSQYSI
jgi:hypothetical protein